MEQNKEDILKSKWNPRYAIPMPFGYEAIYEAMEEYAEQWQSKYNKLWEHNKEKAAKIAEMHMSLHDHLIKYDELKAENRVQQAAIELLVEKYKAQKERAECCRNVLQDLVESIPNQTEDADWWPDSLRTAIEKANEYIQDWQNKEGV